MVPSDLLQDICMKVVLLNPRTQFGTPSEVVRLSGGTPEETTLMHTFRCKTLAFIVEGDGLPNELACAFLQSVALRSRSATGDTVRTYAEALIHWLHYLRLGPICPTSAIEEDLRLYSNNLVNSATEDGRSRYAATTCNLRIAVAIQFHLWGQTKGRMPSELGKFLAEREPHGRHNFNYRRRSSDSFAVRVIDRLPRVLNLEAINRLFLVAPHDYKLMFRWAVATGMRRFEICQLQVSDLPTADQVAANNMELVPISILRKGSRVRTVQAPAQLVEETLWYVATRRPAAANPECSQLVFLSRSGVPLVRQSLSRAFRQCADVIGSDATLHHLRHTFATHVLAALESLEGQGTPMNSLKTLQVLLGHSNVTTTEIYLRAIEASSDEVRDVLDFLYGATL